MWASFKREDALFMYAKKLHRNSQKRFYGPNKFYFITTVTYKRYPYFCHNEFCEIFINNLYISKKIKKFNTYGWVILPDHIHLLLNVIGKHNISQIMQSVKMNASRDINKIIKKEFNYKYGPEGEKPVFRLQNIYPRLQPKTSRLQLKQYNLHRPFKWQKSFHDHIIRHQTDFNKHINYIKNNPYKHKMIKKHQKYPWIYIYSEYY